MKARYFCTSLVGSDDLQPSGGHFCNASPCSGEGEGEKATISQEPRRGTAQTEKEERHNREKQEAMKADGGKLGIVILHPRPAAVSRPPFPLDKKP